MMDSKPGTEPDLSEMECGRCGDLMLHQVIGLSAHFPLCILWYVACGECGYEAQAWEDRPGPIRYGGGQARPQVLPQQIAEVEKPGEDEEE